MINNSTNLNKTNNHLLHQTTEKNTQYMGLVIQVLDWDRHNNVAELNQLL